MFPVASLRRGSWRRRPGWHFAPRVALARELVGIVVERAHVGGVELLLVHHGELRSDEGEIEVDLVLLRRPVDPVEITDPLRLDHRADRAADDAERAPVSLRPIRIEPRVANDVY